MRKSPYFALIGLFLAMAARSTSADTVKEVAQEIRAGSALPLHQNVASFWANNLLAAQDPSVCSYCASEPDSLQLSINAVLKAIRIEADTIYGAGLSFCNLTNCTIANTQSTIAIDDRASITLTPAALNFGDVNIATPEPETWLLTFAGLLLLGLVCERSVSRFSGFQAGTRRSYTRS